MQSKFLAASLIVCAACSEPRTEKTQLPDAAPVVAIASATSSALVEAPAPMLASAAPSASNAITSRLSAAEESRFDAAIRGAMERNEIPGAVLVVFRHGQIVLRRAYGFRAKEPAELRMTVDTLFDLASLTKPLATATSILLLAERGVLRLQDPLQKWLPA